MRIHTILKTPGVVKHKYGFYVVSGGTIHAGRAYDHWGGRTVTFTDGRVVANGSKWGIDWPTNLITYCGRDLLTGLRVRLWEDGSCAVLPNRHQRKHSGRML
jgi:hypothetical protein